jgi:hypothetical protein
MLTSFLTQPLQILQALVETEIFHPVDTDLDPQKGAELLVHTAHEVFAVDAHHMMAVVKLFEHAVELTAQPFGDAHPEDVGDLIGGQAEESHFAGMLKNLVDREVPLENEIAAVFDLIDGVPTAQVDGFAVLLGEFRRQQPTPVVQTFLDDVSAQLVGGCL